MHLSLILPVLAGLASAVTTTPPHRRHDPFPGPREVQLVQLAFAGSGCPVGFLPAQNQTGPTTLTLPKTNVTAESGRNISIASSRSNCQMLAKLKYSPGWQFSVSQADYTGYVDLPAGVTGTSKTIYYFSGGSDQATSNITIVGPYQGTYFRNDRFNSTNTVWSPCGSEALLNINSDVRLAGPLGLNQTAVIGVTTLGKVDISWRQCGHEVILG